MHDPDTRWTLTLPGAISAMAWSDDGRLAVSAEENLLLYAADGSLIWRMSGAGTRCRSLDWSPDGTTIAGAGYGIRLFSAVDGSIQRVLTSYEHRAAWSRCGRWLFSGTAGGAYGKHRTVLCRRAADLEVAWERKLSRGDSGVEALGVFGDGAQVLATDVDGTGYLAVLDALTGKKLRTVRCLGTCRRIVAAPDGSRFFFTGSSSPYPHHLDRSPRSQPLPAYRPNAGPLTDLAASPSPATFAGCGQLTWDDSGTGVWRFVEVGGAWSASRIGDHAATHVAWSPDGALLVLGDGTKLTALDAGGLVVGAPVTRPAPVVLDVHVPEPKVKAAKAESAATAKKKAAAELVGLFGNVMIAAEADRAGEAAKFNTKLDAWFARYPSESVASVAMIIAAAVAAANEGVTRSSVYPTVFADLVRVRGS